MKKTRKELNQVQEEAVIRRHLLESGRIRLVTPKKATSQPPQKDEAAGKPQHEPA